MWWRSRWVLTIGLLLAAVALQGQSCQLSEKEINDFYTTVIGVTAGVEQHEIGINFPKSYCALAAPVRWSGKITQSNPPPSGAALRFEKCAGSTCATIATYSMSIATDGTIPSQMSTFPGACFAPGNTLNVYFTAFGGNVDPGAQLRFGFSYNISDGDGEGVTRFLTVEAARRGAKAGVRPGGKVLIDPPGPDSECVLDNPSPGVKVKRCFEEYPDQQVVTLTAVPDEFSQFNAWDGEDCPNLKEPVCPVTMDKDKTITGRFEPKK